MVISSEDEPHDAHDVRGDVGGFPQRQARGETGGEWQETPVPAAAGTEEFVIGGGTHPVPTPEDLKTSAIPPNFDMGLFVMQQQATLQQLTASQVGLEGHMMAAATQMQQFSLQQTVQTETITNLAQFVQGLSKTNAEGFDNVTSRVE